MPSDSSHGSWIATASENSAAGALVVGCAPPSPQKSWSPPAAGFAAAGAAAAGAAPACSSPQKSDPPAAGAVGYAGSSSESGTSSDGPFCPPVSALRASCQRTRKAIRCWS